MNLEELNALDENAAAQEFLRCCGSSRWATRMAQARPFASADEMSAAADTAWWALARPDWLEAFAAHPQIGSSAPVSAWSAMEQTGVAGAAERTRLRLAEANRDYQTRFGYIFIVCATGKSADEMLDLLEARLRHDPDHELRIAAEEQRKITQLRLTKLLDTSIDHP
jgi:2-oxo-4-hydroxy-4-carboxy-5-ureidoimidazoline decarboxylase